MPSYFSKWLYQFTCPPAGSERWQGSASLPTLRIAGLVDVKEYLNVVLTCIPLVTLGIFSSFNITALDSS